MRCGKSIQQMYLYVSGDLSARQRIRFEQHVDHCSECRQALREYRQIIQAYQHVSSVSTCSVTAQQIVRYARESHKVGFQIFTLFPGKRIAVAAALIVILVSTVLGTLWWCRTEKNMLQPGHARVDIFKPASFTLYAPELSTSVFRLAFPQPSEQFDILANDVSNLRRSGMLSSRDFHVGGFQNTERIKKKIEELRADDWSS